MDTTPKYIKDRGYEVEDNFITSLEEIDEQIAIKIAMYIEQNLTDISPNDFITYVLGGVVHHYNEPITFAVDDDEWCSFDNFMIECLQLYLKSGIS